MLKRKTPKERPKELILQHFILAIIVLTESLIKVLNIIIPSPNKAKVTKVNEGQKGNIQELRDIELTTSFLEKKNNKEIRSILKNIDMYSHLNKRQLTEIIISNPQTLEIFRIERMKECLRRMTNQELRSLLKGFDGISRFRKSQLIEMVINQDHLNPKI